MFLKKSILFTATALSLALATAFFIVGHKICLQNKTITRLQACLLESEREAAQLKEQVAALKAELAAAHKEKDMPTVYLTFDDGPSQNTVKILEILEHYNVKATFFVTGKAGADGIYRKIVEGGHGYGNHTYSHEYDEVYASSGGFWKNIQKNDELFFDVTGRHLEIMRFPGGSNNTVSERYCKGIMPVLCEQANARGINYFDWNVSSRDAEKNVQDKNVIISSVVEGCRGKSRAIVLMHDSAAKTTTVEALPTIIEALKNEGFRFDILTKNSIPIRF